MTTSKEEERRIAQEREHRLDWERRRVALYFKLTAERMRRGTKKDIQERRGQTLSLTARREIIAELDRELPWVETNEGADGAITDA